MNIRETITRIVNDRMAQIELFPGDTELIRQELEIAVAVAIEETMLSVMQDMDKLKGAA